MCIKMYRVSGNNRIISRVQVKRVKSNKKVLYRFPKRLVLYSYYEAVRQEKEQKINIRANN